MTTSTTGSSLDTNGYTVVLDDTTPRPIGINETIRFTGLTEGVHKAELTGVAHNCTVAAPNPVRFEVATTFVSSIAFTVSCTATAPTTGDLTVTAATTGQDLDPNGYAVSLSPEAQGKRIGANDSVTFTGLSPGPHQVRLEVGEVSRNCTVSGENPRTVTVPARGTAGTTFSVSCTARPRGDLAVSVATAGLDLDPDGYTVSVSGSELASDPPSQAVAPNGGVTFAGIFADAYWVFLSGLASNCSVSGDGVQTVTVPAGGTASATFSVSCIALGDFSVTTSTTGTGIPPEYSLEIWRPGAFGPYRTERIGANATATFSGIISGDNMVGLGSGPNCTVSGANPRAVTVPAGGAASATFSVSCVADPATGNLHVTTSTTGTGIPSGYQFDISGPSGLWGERIGANATVTVFRLFPGDYTVELVEVDPKCVVSGANRRTVTVPAGGAGSTTFSVSCTAAGT